MGWNLEALPPRFQTLARPTCNSHETFAKADNLPTSIEILMVGKLVGRNEKRARRRIFTSLMAEWTAANLFCHSVSKSFFPEISPLKYRLLLRQIMSRRTMQCLYFGYVYWYAQDCTGTLCC